MKTNDRVVNRLSGEIGVIVRNVEGDWLVRYQDNSEQVIAEAALVLSMPINNKLKMTKKAFLNDLQHLYRIGNVSDHESNPNKWTKPSMSGFACCAHIDMMLHDLKASGIISDYEQQYFYDSLQ